jgi:hypothetical protein
VSIVLRDSHIRKRNIVKRLVKKGKIMKIVAPDEVGIEVDIKMEIELETAVEIKVD